MKATRLVGWFADAVPSYIDGIAAVGANSVALGPYYVMKNWNDSDIGKTARDAAAFISTAQYARSLGLQVVWKPIIDCDSYVGDPYDTGFRTGILPANMELWMQDYIAKCWEPFVELMDVAAVHTELSTISSLYGESFIELIAWLRSAGFSGPVTTSADFTPIDCPYWACLDWIGGDAYPTIRTDTMANAVEDWTALAQQAAVAHAQTGCGIYFGELAANAGVTLNPAQIQTIYASFWEVFGPLDWWTGLSYWRWPFSSSPPPASLTTAVTGGLRSYPDCELPAAEVDEGLYFVRS
ncbi:MAG: hypothetical protein FWC87_05215 [Acidimicrobiaceae bacterium]|nr:hypothetical protein [Acidimicrobiaceae bacterium]